MKKILNILFMALFILLSVILGILATRLLEENRGLKAENEKLVGQSADTEEKLKELQEKVAELEASPADTDSPEADVSDTDASGVDSAGEGSKEENTDLSREAQLTKSAIGDTVDVGALAAGTIFSSEEIDAGNLS